MLQVGIVALMHVNHGLRRIWKVCRGTRMIEKWKALLPSKSPVGRWLMPRWLSFIFGGNYCQRKAKIQTQTGGIITLGGGYGWRPSLLKCIHKFYRENWGSHGKTLLEFCKFADLLHIRESDKILSQNWWFGNPPT